MSDRDEKATQRTLPVLLLVLLIATMILFVCPFLIGILGERQPPRTIDRLRLGDGEYILTCKSHLDGDVDLFLHECRETDEESCEIVATHVTFGHPCEYIMLEAHDGNLVISGFTYGTRTLLFSFSPD